MFMEELTDLKNRYLDRFALMHVLSDESQEVKLLEGLLNREKCEAILAALIPVAEIDLAFIIHSTLLIGLSLGFLAWMPLQKLGSVS